MSRVKRTAHRPSQSDQQYVKNSRGERVLNTAYEEKNIDRRDTNVVREDISNDFDYEELDSGLIEMSKKYTLDRGNVEDYVEAHIDNIHDVSDMLMNGDVPRAQQLDALRGIMASTTNAYDMKMAIGGKVDANANAASDAFRDAGINMITYDRTNYDGKESSIGFIENTGVNGFSISLEDGINTRFVENEDGSFTVTDLPDGEGYVKDLTVLPDSVVVGARDRVYPDGRRVRSITDPDTQQISESIDMKPDSTYEYKRFSPLTGKPVLEVSSEIDSVREMGKGLADHVNMRVTIKEYYDDGTLKSESTHDQLQHDGVKNYNNDEMSKSIRGALDNFSKRSPDGFHRGDKKGYAQDGSLNHYVNNGLGYRYHADKVDSIKNPHIANTVIYIGGEDKNSIGLSSSTDSIKAKNLSLRPASPSTQSIPSYFTSRFNSANGDITNYSETINPDTGELIVSWKQGGDQYAMRYEALEVTDNGAGINYYGKAGLGGKIGSAKDLIDGTPSGAKLMVTTNRISSFTKNGQLDQEFIKAQQDEITANKAERDNMINNVKSQPMVKINGKYTRGTHKTTPSRYGGDVTYFEFENPNYGDGTPDGRYRMKRIYLADYKDPAKTAASNAKKGYEEVPTPADINVNVQERDRYTDSPTGQTLKDYHVEIPQEEYDRLNNS